MGAGSVELVSFGSDFTDIIAPIFYAGAKTVGRRL